jgi:hypothetical protein
MTITIQFKSLNDTDIDWNMTWPEGRPLVLPEVGDFASMYSKGTRKVTARHFEYDDEGSLRVLLMLEH